MTPPSDAPDPQDSPDPNGRPDAPPPQEQQEVRDEDVPYGAIIVTAVVAVAILVSWYGMYALNLVRS